MIDAPIRCGVEVTRAARVAGTGLFRIETSEGVIEAKNIICATGAFQTPVIPPVVPENAPVTQLHSFDYRNPEQLPEGAVLVVGAGSSGTQIAQELMEAGRDVFAHRVPIAGAITAGGSEFSAFGMLPLWPPEQSM